MSLNPLVRRPHSALPWRRAGTDPVLVATGMRLLGMWLVEARVRAGMSQGQVARRSGLHQSTISRLENGKLEGLQLYRLAAVIALLDGALRDLPISRR